MEPVSHRAVLTSGGPASTWSRKERKTAEETEEEEGEAEGGGRSAVGVVWVVVREILWGG